MTAAKAAADKRIAELTMQNKKDVEEIALLRKQLADGAAARDALTKRLTELDAQLKAAQDDSATLKKEFTELAAAKDVADKRVSDTEVQLKKTTDVTNALKRQLADTTTAKDAAEKRVSEVESDLAKTTNEFAAHMEECDQARSAYESFLRRPRSISVVDEPRRESTAPKSSSAAHAVTGDAPVTGGSGTLGTFVVPGEIPHRPDPSASSSGLFSWLDFITPSQ
jgi:myosin heavy subunit